MNIFIAGLLAIGCFIEPSPSVTKPNELVTTTPSQRNPICETEEGKNYAVCKENGVGGFSTDSSVPKADVESNTIKFAVAVAQSLQTYERPNQYSSNNMSVLNILEPYEVTSKQDVLHDNGTVRTWVELKDKFGN
ncbi:MAG: hypothetical protein VYB27_07015, partial [Candidatus Thermoplasmatota archaeon]|nr:hypothetical protein [Candidatus Thermoplasmatota archaeon]